MTTRGEITARALRYLHRDDFTTADFDQAFRVATAEIGTLLRCPANESETDYTGSALTNPLPLPAALRQIRSVEVSEGGAWSVLSAPRDYRVSAGEIRWRWFPLGGPVRLVGWNEPDAIGSADTSSNAVMQLYPELYLWRVLAELAMIAQDVDLVTGYGAAFRQRVEEINAQSAALQFSAPAMIAG